MFQTFLSILSTYYTRKLLLCSLGFYFLLCGLFFYYKKEIQNGSISSNYALKEKIFAAENFYDYKIASLLYQGIIKSQIKDNEYELFKLTKEGRQYFSPDEINPSNPIKSLFLSQANNTTQNELEKLFDPDYLPDLFGINVFKVSSDKTWDDLLKIVRLRPQLKSITIGEIDIPPSYDRLKELIRLANGEIDISYNHQIVRNNLVESWIRFSIKKLYDAHFNSYVCFLTQTGNPDDKLHLELMTTLLKELSPVIKTIYPKMKVKCEVTAKQLESMVNKFQDSNVSAFSFAEKVYLAAHDVSLNLQDANQCLQVLKSQNPGTTFIGLWISPGRTLSACCYQWLAFIPISLLMIQLSAQFLTVPSRLIPGYQTKHFLSAGILLFIYLFFTVLLLSISYIHSLVAIFLALFPFVFITLFTLLKRFFRPASLMYAQSFQLMTFLFCAQVAFVYCCAYYFQDKAFEIDQWLRGEYPWLTLYFILFETLCIGYLISELSSIQRRMIQYAPYKASLNLVNYLHHDFTLIDQNKKQTDKKRWLSFWNILRNNKLTDLLTQTSNGKRFTPSQLWLHSQEYSMSSPWIAVGFICLMLSLNYSLDLLGEYCKLIWDYKPVAQPFSTVTHFVFSVSLAYIMINLTFVLGSLLARRSVILFESLHPWTKQEFYQTVRDHLSLELRSSGWLFLITILVYDQGRQWYLWPFYLISCWLICQLSISLLMILLTSSRLNLHLFLVAPILIFAIFFSLFYLEERGVELILSTLYSFPCQIIFIITTFGIHHYLKTYSTHRWQNLEPARLVRS